MEQQINSRPVEETAQQAKSFIASDIGGEEEKKIGIKVRDLVLTIVTRDHWYFILGLTQIFTRFFSDPLVMMLRKRIGERHFSWSIVLSWFVIVNLFSFLATIAGPFIGGYRISPYALFAKVYIVAGLIQYAGILYRRYFGDPDDMVYSFSMGNSTLYNVYLKSINIIKHTPLSESHFQKYIECGLVILLGMILSIGFGSGFGKFLIFSGAALHLTIVQRENNMREKIMDSVDARIVNDQLMHHMQGKKSTPVNNQGFPMADVIVNEAKRAYGNQIKDEFTEQLERLKKEEQPPKSA